MRSVRKIVQYARGEFFEYLSDKMTVIAQKEVEYSGEKATEFIVKSPKGHFFLQTDWVSDDDTDVEHIGSDYAAAMYIGTFGHGDTTVAELESIFGIQMREA
jgi:hypothetical protein